MASDAPSLGALGTALVSIRAETSVLRADIQQAKQVVEAGAQAMAASTKQVGAALASVAQQATGAFKGVDISALKTQLAAAKQSIQDIEAAIKNYQLQADSPAGKLLGSQLADAKAQAVSLETAITAETQRLLGMGEAAKSAKASMDLLAGGMSAAGKTADQTTASSIRLTEGMTAAGKAAAAAAEPVDDLRKRTAATGMQLLELGRGLREVGLLMSAAFTVPIAAAGAATIHFGADFETQMTRVSTLAGASIEEVLGLKQAVLDLGPAVGVGPAELEKGLFVIESFGQRGKVAMDTLTVAGKMSALGMGDVAVNAKALIGVIAAYADQNMTAAKAGDILAKTVQLGNMRVDELTGAMARVNPVAAAFRIKFEDITTSIATFTHMGGSVDKAVTGIIGVLSALEKGAPGVEKGLNAMGLSAEGLRKDIETHGLTEALIHLTEVAKSTEGGLQDLMKVGNMRSFVELMSTAGMQTDQMRKIAAGMRDAIGTIDDGTKQLDKTWGQTWNKMKAAAEALFIRMSDTLLPILKQLASVFEHDVLPMVGALVKGFNDLPQPVQLFALGLAGLTATIGPLLMILGTAVMAYGHLTRMMVGEAGVAIAGQTASLGFLETAWGILSTEVSFNTITMGANSAMMGIVSGAGTALTGVINGLNAAMAAMPVAMVAGALGVLTLGIAKMIEQAADAELRLQGVKARQDAAILAMQHGADFDEIQKHSGAASAEAWVKNFNDAWAKRHVDPLTPINDRLKEMTANGASAIDKMRELAVAVESVASKGRLGPQQIKDVVERIRESGAKPGDLPPVLKNIQSAYDRPFSSGVGSGHKLTGEEKAEARDLEILADATKSYDEILQKVSNDTYEGIKAEMARTGSIRAVAREFGVEQQIVKDVISIEKAYAAEAKTALAKANQEYSDSIDESVGATAFYENVLNQLGNELYEGIAADKARGISTASVAAAFGVSKKSVEEVTIAEKKFKEQLEDTDKAIERSESVGVSAAEAIGKGLNAMPDVLRNLARETAVWTDALNTAADATHGLVSGLMLASHALPAVTNQKPMGVVGATFDAGTNTFVDDAAAHAITGRMEEIARSYIPLKQAQIDAIQKMHELGFSAEEIAKTTGVSIDRVTAQTARWSDALSGLADMFAKLGQAAGGSLGPILSGLGQVVVMLDAANKATSQKDAHGVELGGNFGVGSVMFNERASAQQRFAAGVQGAGAVAQGAMNVWSATDSQRTAMGNAGAGALAGAQAGAAFGPWGMAVGAAAGFFVGLIRGKPEWAKAADEVGKDFGAKISDALAKEIQATAESTFGGNRLAAELTDFDKIISEAGGLTEKNIGQMTSRLHDAFSLVQTGVLSASQAAAILDKNFGQFVSNATSGAGVLAGRIVDLIKLQQQFGIQSQQMQQYVAGQIGNVFAGLAAGLGPGADAAKKAKQDAKDVADYTAQLAAQSTNAQTALQDAVKQNGIDSANYVADLKTKQAEAEKKYRDDVAKRAVQAQKDDLLEIDKLRSNLADAQKDATVTAQGNLTDRQLADVQKVADLRKQQDVASAALRIDTASGNTVGVSNDKQQIADLQKEIDRITGSSDVVAKRAAADDAVKQQEAVKKILDLKKQQAEFEKAAAIDAASGNVEGAAIDKANIEDAKRQINLLIGGEDSLVAKIVAANDDLDKQEKLFKTVGLTSQGAVAGAAGAILAGINQLEKQGVSLRDAMKQASPAIQALRDQLEKTGADGGDAFRTLTQYVDIANDAIAGPALDAAAGFGQALVGLNNSGLLTGEMFKGLAGQITQTHDALIEQGVDGTAVMRLMQPQLQQIWEIQKQTGMAVDDATQALLDEAVAAGQVGEKFEGPQQQMIDALGKTNDLLTSIAKTLGADIPDAAEKGAAGVKGAIDKLPPRIKIPVDFPTGQAPDLPPGTIVGDQGFGYSRGGVVTPSGPAPQYMSVGGMVMQPAYGRSQPAIYMHTGGVVPSTTQIMLGDSHMSAEAKYYAIGGPVGPDTVAAWLQPGEGVITTTGMSALSALNRGDGGAFMKAVGGSGVSVQDVARAGIALADVGRSMISATHTTTNSFTRELSSLASAVVTATTFHAAPGAVAGVPGAAGLPGAPGAPGVAQVQPGVASGTPGLPGVAGVNGLPGPAGAGGIGGAAGAAGGIFGLFGSAAAGAIGAPGPAGAPGISAALSLIAGQIAAPGAGSVAGGPVLTKALGDVTQAGKESLDEVRRSVITSSESTTTVIGRIGAALLTTGEVGKMVLDMVEHKPATLTQVGGMAVAGRATATAGAAIMGGAVPPAVRASMPVPSGPYEDIDLGGPHGPDYGTTVASDGSAWVTTIAGQIQIAPAGTYDPATGKVIRASGVTPAAPFSNDSTGWIGLPANTGSGRVYSGRIDEKPAGLTDDVLQQMQERYKTEHPAKPTQYFDTSGLVKPGVQYFDTSGIVMPKSRGNDTEVVMASPGELLLNIAHQGNLASQIQQLAGAASSTSGEPGPIDITLNAKIVIGGESLGSFTEKVTWRQLKSMWRNNRNGSKTEAKILLDVP